jgi:hypothetical protein
VLRLQAHTAVRAEPGVEVHTALASDAARSEGGVVGHRNLAARRVGDDRSRLTLSRGSIPPGWSLGLLEGY